MKPAPRRTRSAACAVPELRAVALERPERSQLATALHRCSESQRAMLALVLIERLSSAEAAVTLGITVDRFDRAYQSVLASLRRRMARAGATWRGTSSPAETAERMRKAS